METSQWLDSGSGLHIGIYGWRKRCLYLLIIILLCVVTINLTLVFWLMKVLNFNTNGMVYLQMVGSGIQFTGKTYILDTLVAKGFFTRPGQVMSMQSSQSLTLRTTDPAGYLGSNIHLDDGNLEINTPSFKVTEPKGKTLFSVDKDAVSLTATSLAISGEGGAVFEGSLQTPVVSAGIRSDLVLESTTKAVQAVTPAGVSIESRAGDILASSLQDIRLNTVDGSIKFESSNVMMPTLKHPETNHRLRKQHHHQERIYQLCVCSNGDLFLGESEAYCVHTDICHSTQ